MKISTRSKLLVLLFLMVTISYMDRVNISVAAPVIMDETGWREDLFGIIFSAFLVGLTIAKIPGGLAADKWGGQIIITVSVIGWSVFTALTPPAVNSIHLLLLVRGLVGVFESMAVPAMASLNAKWFPKQFATAQMLGISGAMFGQLIAYPTTTWMVSHYSWPIAFYSYAVLGVIWIPFWFRVSAHSLMEQTSIAPAKLRPIEGEKAGGNAPVGGEDQKLSVMRLARSLEIIAIMIGYFCFSYGGWMMVVWLPTYLVKARNFSFQQMGWVGMVPTMAGFAGLILGGITSDYFLRHGRSMRFSRQGFPASAIVLATSLVIIAVSVESPFYAVLFLVAFQLVNMLGTSGFWSTASALHPGQVGAVTGIMDFGGSFGGIVGSLVAGLLVAKTGNWALPFYTAAGSSLIGAFLLFFCVRIKAPRPEGLLIREERGLALE
ncbi:MAG: MFS transporter [Acidobacteria bacterium]|nr:MFS transporter [Acidobacteriota bacterium]